MVYMPLGRGVAEANCPKALVLNARTGLASLSLTSTSMFGKILPLGSLTIPTTTFGVSDVCGSPILFVIACGIALTCCCSCFITGAGAGVGGGATCATGWV